MNAAVAAITLTNSREAVISADGKEGLMPTITYVAFFRGINVGGHAIVKMEALRAAFATAGGKNVRTYIQSGNVLFDSPQPEAAAISRNLRAKLRNLLGADPVIFLRSLTDLARLVEDNPFAKYSAESKAKFYVAFLAAPPRKQPAFPLLLPKEGLEAFGMASRDVFIVARLNPEGSYGFPNSFIEKELGADATSRNWNTVTKIVKFAQNQAQPIKVAATG